MTVPPNQDAELITQIKESWSAPQQSDVQRRRFEHQLNRALAAESRRPTNYGLKLALVTLMLALGAVAMSSSRMALESPASLDLTNEESWLVLWTDEETSFEEESLPDDYLVLSQLID